MGISTLQYGCGTLVATALAIPRYFQFLPGHVRNIQREPRGSWDACLWFPWMFSWAVSGYVNRAIRTKRQFPHFPQSTSGSFSRAGKQLHTATKFARQNRPSYSSLVLAANYRACSYGYSALPLHQITSSYSALWSLTFKVD